MRGGLAEKGAEKRAKAVNSLGLLTHNAEAEKAAVQALKDEKASVRLAAASALGSMRAIHAKAELESALDDEEPAVVLASANSLMLLDDLDSAYKVYYDVLTGTMRTRKGLIKERCSAIRRSWLRWASSRASASYLRGIRLRRVQNDREIRFVLGARRGGKEAGARPFLRERRRPPRGYARQELTGARRGA